VSFELEALAADGPWIIFRALVALLLCLPVFGGLMLAGVALGLRCWRLAWSSFAACCLPLAVLWLWLRFA
jgi:hypothetical protein